MPNPTEDQEWRGLIQRLHSGTEPKSPPEDVAPMFDDSPARSRVGVVIAKSILGTELYELYRLYCGDTSLRR